MSEKHLAEQMRVMRVSIGKEIIALLLLAATALMIGCSHPSPRPAQKVPSSPQQTVTAFVGHLAADRYESAIRLVVDPRLLPRDDFERARKQAFGSQKQHVESVNMRRPEELPQGTLVIVESVTTRPGGRRDVLIQLVLVRKGGRWLVEDFDTSQPPRE